MSCDNGNVDIIIPSFAHFDTPRASMTVGVETDVITRCTTHLRCLRKHCGFAAHSVIEDLEHFLNGDDDATIPPGGPRMDKRCAAENVNDYSYSKQVWLGMKRAAHTV